DTEHYRFDTHRTIQNKKTMTIDFMNKMLKKYRVPGYALSVVYKNQTIISQGFGTKQYGNASNVVTQDTQFQIGSYTKTFIAMGIAKLVDEGNMTWTDSVKQHLPWFELQDKYAEKYTTIADLLAMNSVFGAYEGDLAWAIGVVPTERELVKNLAYFDTTRPLRPGYAYSNLNFEILGQVIEYKTNMKWSDYLDKTFFKPLGMHHTYSRAFDVPNTNDLSFGHKFCGDKVAGPYSLQTSVEIFLSKENNYIAAGSILSTAADLSKFSKFLLSKGEGIFKSPQSISDMITGRSFDTMMVKYGTMMSFSYNPDGGAFTAGYGFDIVGDVMYGFHYYDKGGDTIAFKTRNGFIPSEDLGVVLLANAEPAGGIPEDLFISDRIRSYILGIFLNIPQSKLQKTYDEAIKAANALGPSNDCNP
ncbi:beta-lactamase, partial [Thraustotheca clavata]